MESLENPNYSVDIFSVNQLGRTDYLAFFFFGIGEFIDINSMINDLLYCLQHIFANKFVSRL